MTEACDELGYVYFIMLLMAVSGLLGYMQGWVTGFNAAKKIWSKSNLTPDKML
jgi:hypothetical protein